MHRAATLLQERNGLIKELAPEVGFRIVNHFSRAFKRIHGCTPEAFRNGDHRSSRKKRE